MGDEHEGLGQEEGPARYDSGMHWPYIERRRPGFDRRKDLCQPVMDTLNRRCEFCESALKVIAAVISILMLLLAGMGIWAWNLQENVWRELLKNRETITQARDQVSKEDLDILNAVRLNREMSEKNQQLILQQRALCAREPSKK